MVRRKLSKSGVIALFCGLLLASSVLLVSLFGLWAAQTLKSEATAYTDNLAYFAASAISTAETGTTATLATALLETAIIRKLEIRNWNGVADQTFRDDDLSDAAEQDLRAVSHVIAPRAARDSPGELTLYYTPPSLHGRGAFAALCLIAGITWAAMMWRAPSALAELARNREPGETNPEEGIADSSGAAPNPPVPAGKPGAIGSTFGGLFESHADMAVLLSVHGHIVDASHGWLRNGGYRRDEVVSVHLTEFIADPDRRMIADRLQRLRAFGVPQAGTLQYLRADGSAVDIWFSATPVKAANGDHFTLAVIREIPEVNDTSSNGPVFFSDHLTGLLNRSGLENALNRMLKGEKQELVCLLVDFDRFKSLIDRHGHQASEDMLRAFTKRLSSSLERVTLAARSGGDEFAFIIAGPRAKQKAERLAEVIHEVTCRPFTLEAGSVTFNVSIGIASLDHSDDAVQLLREATVAVSEQKVRGGNGTLWFRPEMLINTRKRAEIEADILRGIEENLFEPYFQPIMNLTTGKVIGFETLMRLNHPDKGVIMPGAFITIAEQTEQIGPAGRQFFAKSLVGFRQICRQAGNEALYLSVNLSPVQLNPEMINFMAEKLDAFGVAPERLAVEITEAVFLEDSDRIRESLHKLRLMGCHLALDDFGTGYSSLSYLSRLQVDIIKIDQSFTRNLTDPDTAVATRSRRLIEGIAAISVNMGCQVVAEGVENEEQARQVHAIGAQYGQGYLYSRPLPLTETIARLSAG